MNPKTIFLSVLLSIISLASRAGIIIESSKDSLYVYDDFSFTSADITQDSTGKGLKGKWTYIEEESGISAQDGYIYGCGNGIIIKREVLNPIQLQGSVFYTSFLASKTVGGEFGILAGRLSDDLPRFGIGVTIDGRIKTKVGDGNTSYTWLPDRQSAAGVFSNDTVYLVVVKWSPVLTDMGWTNKMQVALFKAGETISEPADGAWTYEQIGNATGLSTEFIKIEFSSPTTIIDELKIGDSWVSVSQGTDIPANKYLTPITLGLPFSNHMVVQRNTRAKIWGWTEADIFLSMDADWQEGIEAETMSDGTGYFEAYVQTPEAGGPYSVTISAGNNTRVLSDVLSGEVWLGSGQSNMDFTLRGADNAEYEIANSSHLNLRLFNVPNHASNDPLVDRPVPYIAGWQVSGPTTSAGFSAVGYFFGREIMQELDVPVGIIGSAYGAAVGEAWIQKEYYARMYCDSELRREFATGERDITTYSTPQAMPCVLYNGMIAPLIDFPIAGVIWYQGEANSNRPEAYRTLLPLIIQNWREKWDTDFPFYIAQLSAFGTSSYDYAFIRESQYIVSQNIPKTGMSNTIDIGDSINIHAKNKQDVGFRLAQLALWQTYRKDVVKSGPLYSGYSIEQNKIKVGFEPITFDGLELRLSSRNPFFIKGEGGFVEAQTKVAGDSIEIWADGITQPTEARYCFEKFPRPTLYNGAGLPAVPFRTNQTVWTDICVTEKTNTSATIRLLGKAVDNLPKEAFMIIDNRTKYADKLPISSALSFDNGRTYTLTGNFSDFTDGWIYIQDILTTSGAPVPFAVTEKEYYAEVLTFTVNQAETSIDTKNGIIYVTPEFNVDLGITIPQYTLSEKASADLSYPVNLNNVFVFTVVSEYGNQKKWTVINVSKSHDTQVNEIEMKTVRVVPSIVKDYTRVIGLNAGDEISLFTSSGICIKKEIANGEEMELNYSNMNEGIYFIRVKDKAVLKTIKKN